MFVPSNEALRKIPDEELEVIKNNSTALRGKFISLAWPGQSELDRTGPGWTEMEQTKNRGQRGKTNSQVAAAEQVDCQWYW